MFTGLVEQVGHLKSITETSYGRKLSVSTPLSSELYVGQSISINGACLSVTACAPDAFTVTAVPETISKTTLGQLTAGAAVNIERAMIANSRLDGHIVQGHVDTTCLVTRTSAQDGERLYEFFISEEYLGLVVPRGSIAVDGISLTIANLCESHISIAIIPHTYQHTNASSWQPGTCCNVEFDILAKYVARQMVVHQKS
ncbi:MAG: riboflavin synthase [Bacteroidetes bacterium]|nr:riboflavin synthase [Bacteroidota bacterium]